jgi:hypothetical protein
MHGRQAVSHAGAAHFPIVAIITTGRGRSPMKALLAPLVAAFDALLGTVGGDIGRCLLVATRGHLHASLCRAKHDRLVADVALGGDVTQLLEHAFEEIAMSALLWALV